MSDRDSYIHQMLTKGPVPEHGESFWAELEARMDSEGEPEFRRPTSKRRFVALGAAAAVIAIGAFALRDTGDTPTSVLTDQPTSSIPFASVGHREAVDAVTRFIDALGSNDLTEAASLLGPRSEEYLNATAGSVAEFLPGAATSYGTWKKSTDRKFAPIEVRTGEFVVVITGTHIVDGGETTAPDAIPVRHAESADAWFVEPWALDPNGESRIELVSPDPTRALPVLGRGLAVGVNIPQPGRVWFGFDAGPLEEADYLDNFVDWSAERRRPGEHVLIVVYETDTIFTVLARTIQVET